MSEKQAILIVAEILATFEGHLEAFNAERTGIVKADDPCFEGRFAGFYHEAKELIDELAKRGYHLVRPFR